MIPISLGRVLVEPFDWLSVSQGRTVCPFFSQSVNWQRHRQSDRQSNQIIAPCAVDNCHRVSPYLASISLFFTLSLPVCLSLCPSVPLSFRYLQQYCLSTRAKLPALSWSLRFSLWMILESSALLLVHISVLTDTLALYIYAQYTRICSIYMRPSLTLSLAIRGLGVNPTLWDYLWRVNIFFAHWLCRVLSAVFLRPLFSTKLWIAHWKIIIITIIIIMMIIIVIMVTVAAVTDSLDMFVSSQSRD